MFKLVLGLALAGALVSSALADEEMERHHDHPAPEHLGRVSFATSCRPGAQAGFNRAVALLHSFAYAASNEAFGETLAADPGCAMALWGEAMSHFHQLWEPYVDSPAELAEATEEIDLAARMAGRPGAATPREQAYVAALGLYFHDAAGAPHLVRARRYSEAMAKVARAWPADDEAQVFYALSLVAIGTATPSDRTHADQKRAAAILEPLWRKHPDHPGIAHYLIHAYDSAELASRGLAAARAYARIAPAAPHALHMPSHIYTRLGLWPDSIAANRAAQAAARAHGDIGEELHAMDYQTYAELQLGRFGEARQVAAEAAAIPDVHAQAFKVGYAANAMPVRVAVETKDWAAAARLAPRAGSAPRTAALVWWARALGLERGRPAQAADTDLAQLRACREALSAAGDAYGQTQTDALVKSAEAWDLDRRGDGAGAEARMAVAADEEDSLEKLPATPGPIVPAREQLGELLLSHHHPAEALKQFKAALALAPGRRGSLTGALAAAEQTGDAGEASRLRSLLSAPR